MIKLWTYEVGAKTGDCSNVAMLQNQSVVTLLHDVATFGSVLGGFLAHFEPIIEGFKAQTRGVKKEEDF